MHRGNTFLFQQNGVPYYFDRDVTIFQEPFVRETEFSEAH
jgi:hypothetical protein